MSIKTVEFSCARFETTNDSSAYKYIDVYNCYFNGKVVMYHHGVNIGTLNFISTKKSLDISEKSPLEKLAETSSVRKEKLNIGFDFSNKGDETAYLKKELSGYIHKQNCIAEGLKELQAKKQMLREQLIDAVNNAQNNGLCVDLIHDELKSFAHEFIIVCENLEIDCDEIPF